MSEYRDEYTETLGAYALDAVDDDERAVIEQHLRTCAWCAAEVAEHREVASFLAHSGTDAPEGVWDRIAAELSPPAPPMRMTFAPVGEVDFSPSSDADDGAPKAASPTEPTGAVVSMDGRRRGIKARTFVAVIGLAACLLVALGLFAVDQNHRLDQARDDEQVALTVPSTGALEVKLSSDSSNSGAQAVVESSGRGYLVAHDLPRAGSDELYQLWGKVDGVVLSLGTFDSGTDVVNFQIDPAHIKGVEAFAVTKEKAPGVIASTQAPVMAGTVA